MTLQSQSTLCPIEDASNAWLVDVQTLPDGTTARFPGIPPGPRARVMGHAESLQQQPTSMKSPADTVVEPQVIRAPCRELFTVAGKCFDTRDVVAFAMLRDEWTGLEERVGQGLACQKHSWSRNPRANSEELAEAADEFRYARNLISAEDFEAWLARAGLTFEQWTAYLDRSCRRRALAVELTAIVSQHHVSDAEVMACVLIEAICSGDLDRFAETLAGRAAVCACNSGEFEGAETVDRALVERVQARCEVLFQGDSSHGLRRHTEAEQIVHLVNIERRFQALVRAALTEEAVQAQIDARCADWIAIGYRAVTFADLDRAREAELCLRLDGETLDDVATRARVTVRRERTLLEGFETAWRAAILSAAQGAILGPLRVPGGFTLAIIDEKMPPSAADAIVRQRAEEAIVAAMTADRRADVRWDFAAPRSCGGD